jgi:hypothetical protein
MTRVSRLAVVGTCVVLFVIAVYACMRTWTYDLNLKTGTFDLFTEHDSFQNTRCVLRIREAVTSSLGVSTSCPYITLFIHFLSSYMTVLA